MKLLFNPFKGVSISDLWVHDTYWFDSKKGEGFNPGEVYKFEDDKTADKFIELYGFLKEITVNEAKEIMDKKNHKFRCEVKDCDFSTNVKIALEGHKRGHDKKDAVDEIGIPVAKSSKSQVEEVKTGDDVSSEIEQQATESGLIGEGLVEENVGRRVANF